MPKSEGPDSTLRVFSFRFLGLSFYKIYHSLFLWGLWFFVVASAFAHEGSVGHRLSPLRKPPDWQVLDAYQYTQTLSEFRKTLKNVFSPDDAFWKYCRVEGNAVTLYDSQDKVLPLFTIYFAEDNDNKRPLPRSFQRSSVGGDQFLKGRSICLDPGHIGGAFSKIEERWFQIGADQPVEEGAMNRWVCQHLEKMLVDAGARVTWTVKDQEPVTHLRPQDLKLEAMMTLLFSPFGSSTNIAQRLQEMQESLFYRNAEIDARAQKVKEYQPDITLCVHFNAAAWGDPNRPELVNENRLVLFVSGAYMESELKYEDQRFDLVYKVLQQVHSSELETAASIAQEMERVWKLPPETYKNWNAVKSMPSSPYVFARNLAANRMFPGPVVFIEGPYMNNKLTYERIQAGDYEGTKSIGANEVPSLFREFAEVIFHGLTRSALPLPD